MKVTMIPKTRSWEQQEWNKVKKLTTKVRTEWAREEVKQARKSPCGQSLPNQNKTQTIMVDLEVFSKIWKKYKEIEWT